MKTIQQVLNNKDNEVKSVSPDTDTKDAIKLMAKSGISSLLVIENDQVLGIFSDKDFTCKVVAEDRLSQDIPISEVMTAPVCAIRPDQNIEDAMSVMTDKRIRHLPVMDGDKLIGLVSIGDLVKSIIKEQQDTIEQLEHYIHY